MCVNVYVGFFGCHFIVLVYHPALWAPPEKSSGQAPQRRGILVRVKWCGFILEVRGLGVFFLVHRLLLVLGNRLVALVLLIH